MLDSTFVALENWLGWRFSWGGCLVWLKLCFWVGDLVEFGWNED